MRYIIGLILLCSIQAGACPQLTGNYTCRNQDGSSDTTVFSQSDSGGITQYVYNGSVMPADNKTYPVPDSANIKNGNFRSWCPDDLTLNAQMLGDYYNNGTQFGSISLNMAFSISSGSLEIVTSGQITNASGNNDPVSQTAVCTKDF